MIIEKIKLTLRQSILNISSEGKYEQHPGGGRRGGRCGRSLRLLSLWPAEPLLQRKRESVDQGDVYWERTGHTESNLHYFGARYYDAGAGRWLSVDPLADSYYAWSAYNCSMNDPFNKYDPDGQFVATISGLAIGAIAGGINAYMNNESIASGMTEGAIAGGIAGAVIDATVATGGGAAVLIAGAAIGGGFGAGVGDVAGQTMKQVQQGTNISDVKINTSQTMSKAVTGFVTGAVSGAAGAVVSKGLSAITNTTKGVQAAGSKMLESTSKSLMKSGASQSTINCVQNKIVSGMQLAGKNTAESALKIRAAATAAIDAAAQGSQINKTKDEDKKE
jgi:RHS repeat-associated protein